MKRFLSRHLSSAGPPIRSVPCAAMTRSRPGSVDFDTERKSECDNTPKRPPPLQLTDLLHTPLRGKLPASAYPQTPVLKGRDAVANAFASFGTSMVSCGFIVLGIVSFLHPSAAAKTYGLPAEAGGWAQAAGVRDVALGAATFALHVTHRGALKVFLPIVALVPIGDAFVVAKLGGGLASGACQMHIAAACCVLVLAVCVHLDPLVPTNTTRVVTGRAVDSV